MASGLLAANDLLRIVVTTQEGNGSIALRHIQLHHGVLEPTDIIVSGPQLPLRSSSMQMVIAIDSSRPIGGRIDLQEVNRILEVGGVLVTNLSSEGSSAESELLAAGFTVSEVPVVEGVQIAVKVWKSYSRDRCPKCGGSINIPLIPEDSKVVKIWSFYCTSCGYVWKSEDFALRE